MSLHSDHNPVIASSEDLKINVDFEKRVVIKPEDYASAPSPMPGVDRMVLDRIGNEMAHATTIVRYAPNRDFSQQAHDGGEEFFVLDGAFADEQGEYPQGTYVRRPVGTPHTLRAGVAGTTLFVKLHQFAKNDAQQTVIDTNKTAWHPGLVNGLQVMPLHEYEGEHVALVRWAPNTKFKPHQHWGGEEIFVLAGVFYDEHDHYPKGSWIRSPHLSQHTPFTKEEGALIYVKVGHLSPSKKE